MKVVVTGGAGFIGSHVVDLYLEQGMEVVVVDDLSTGRLQNLNPEAVFYQLDIRSPEIEEVFQRERPQVVNHHAAQMDVRRSVAEPIFDADVNINGSLNLLECARRYGTERFIYISSGGAVYGEPEYLPCDEDHPINPICQYGASKHTVEHYLFMYRQNYGLEYSVLRYPNVYGPRQDPRGEAGVVAIFTGQMLAGEQVVINGDGEQERDFVYVSDCAQANLLALTATGDRGVYNLGSGVGTSVNDIFARMKTVTGYGEAPVYGPSKLGETRSIYLSAAKAHKELGWSPATNLEKGLEQTVAWHRSSHGLGQKRFAPRSIPVPAERIAAGSASVVEELNTGDARAASDRSDRNPQNTPGLPILRSINLKLREHSELDQVLQALLESALELVGAESGSVFALDERWNVGSAVIKYDGQIHHSDSQGEPVDDLLREGLAGWVVEEGRAALVENTLEDPRWLTREWDHSIGIPRSAIAVPLIVSDKVVGVLTLVRSEAARFQDEHLALLMTVSGIVSYEGANLPLPGNGRGAARASLSSPREQNRFTIKEHIQ